MKGPRTMKGAASSKLPGIALLALAGMIVLSNGAQAQTPNRVVGTWHMLSAQLDPGGRNTPAYGQRPNSLLVFTPDMHFIEVLTDADVPRFASNVRGKGTDKENRAAMAGSIGFFGTYAVDANGDLSGNHVEGSTFPNWVGNTRTRQDLQMPVKGDRMTERFQRPDGTRIEVIWQRVSR